MDKICVFHLAQFLLLNFSVVELRSVNVFLQKEIIMHYFPCQVLVLLTDPAHLQLN